MKLVDFNLHDGRVLSVDSERIVALIGQGDSTVILAAGLNQAVLGTLDEVKKIVSPSQESVVEATETTKKGKK